MTTETPQEGAETGTQLSEETARLAALGRGENPPAAEPAPEPKARPDYIPEKFWDADKGEARFEEMARGYAELEKKLGAPKDPAENPPANPEGDPKEVTEEALEAAAAVLPAELFTSAQTEYAESGDLTAETREKIIASGIPEETLNVYLAGVKALSDQMTAAIYDKAGGKEAYTKATEWARDNWTQSQIDKFNASLADPDLRDVAIQGLMASASGGQSEGALTLPGGGAVGGDYYTDKDEFLKDLAAADKANDALARKQAVAKLDRSKKAGRLKEITPRTGLAQFG